MTETSYPRRTETGDIIWACCESQVGGPCQHRADLFDDTPETPDQVAARFELPVEWARLHVGRHRCVDGRWYTASCLVTDPSCDHIARRRMGL